MSWTNRVLLFMASAIIAGSVYLKGRLGGWFTDEISTVELAEIIEPNLRTFKPDGGGPFETVLMFHGCGGDPLQQDYWAKVLQSWGMAAVVVDSFTGRDIEPRRALSHVCRGRQLIGAERAGDVLTALAWLKRQDWVNPRSIHLAGWSHGAWAVMDAYAMSSAGLVPHGLDRKPDAELADVSSLLLFYSYCGLGSKTGAEGWLYNPDVLAVDIADDAVVGTRGCDKAWRAIGTSGSLIQHEVLTGVGHAFDVYAIKKITESQQQGKLPASTATMDMLARYMQNFLNVD